MSEIGYRTAVADPERALEDLQARETETAKLLADIREQIKMVNRILDTQRCWAEKFGMDPEPEDDHPSPDEPSKINQTTKVVSIAPLSSAPPPRRVQVLRLLSQDPSYWWKTRDIAEALAIDNQKSLRVLLGQLARKGELIKTADAWFRYNDGTSIPEPESASVAADEGAAM
ncbi:hypothetical protein [Actinoallomurus sp. CA-142502]|uniref:hypothetical protein n=1 Tax=Actinoallomurus sp. CA-142502 TaxID=3239885 RepID=UPI003D8AFBCD